MRVFISYRREDSAGQAGWLYDRLSARYSPESIFMDVSGIEPGADFQEAIENAVGHCNVMLAVIGPKWPGKDRATGQRRIDQPNDFVRLEIAAAFRRKIAVVCVLVDGAGEPERDRLPQGLADLVQTRAIELRETSWDEDVAQLIQALEEAAGLTKPASQGWWSRHKRAGQIVTTGAALIAAIGIRTIYMASAHPDSAEARLAARPVTLVTPSASVKASPTRALAVLPDGRVAYASSNGIFVWNLVTPGSPPILLDQSQDAMALTAVSGGRLAWGTRSGGVYLWDLRENKYQAVLEGHTGAVVAIASMDDGRLASGSWDGTVRLWSLATGKLEKTLATHNSQVRALAAVGNGRLVSGTTDGTIVVWNLAGETEKLKTLDRHGGAVNALAGMSDQRLAVGAEDGAVEIWNYGSDVLETKLRAQRDWINALAILPDSRVASASDDSTIVVWNPSKSYADARLEGHRGRVNALGVLANGELVSGSEDGTIRLWHLGR